MEHRTVKRSTGREKESYSDRKLVLKIMLKDKVRSMQCLLNNLFPLHERVLACFRRSDYYLNARVSVTDNPWV